jgi:acetyltransferase-like isoleucine patch superfamily enzyme
LASEIAPGFNATTFQGFVVAPGTPRVIIDRMRAGGIIPHSDPQWTEVWEIVNQTIALLVKLNSSTNADDIRAILSEILGQTIDPSTTVLAPFSTNFGKHTHIGKNVFINHGCSFLDLGGITIEDGVMLGSGCHVYTLNHRFDNPEKPIIDQGHVASSPVLLRKGCWIRANSIILPGVEIGENAVIGAGSVVTKSIPQGH